MQPPPGVQPNFVNPTTLAKPIVAISVATSIFAVAFLSARLYSRFKITRSAGYDDYASIVAMASSLSLIGLILNIRKFARHMWDMSITSFDSSFFKILLAVNIVGAIALLFAKLSILMLLFRLFSLKQRFRSLIYVGMLWATLNSITTVIVAGALCAPRQGESFAGLSVAQRCQHEGIWAVVQGAMSVILDSYVFCLPILIVWKLQLGLKRKLGVLAIFSTGLM